MAALGLDQILNLAQQYGGAEQSNVSDDAALPAREPAGRRPLARGLRRHNRAQALQARQRSAKAKAKQRQLVIQSRSFNRTGRARTLDHQFPDKDMGRQSLRGRGQWKTWTAAAVLRAGFGSETATCRQVANEVEGASGYQARAARFACAGATCQGQAQACEKVALESADEPLKILIRNLMFDESTFPLKVGKDAANSCSVLCSHAQWSMGFQPSLVDERNSVRDEHIVRCPQILAPMNSATMWRTLSSHPGNIGSCDVVADRVCTITTCDAHAANLKLLKHLNTELPNDHLFLPLLCTQHRNGNVVEQLTQLLGNLGGCFCVSRVLNSRQAVQTLRKRVGAALAQALVVIPSEPAGVQRDWEEERSQTRHLLQLAAMFEASSKDSDDEEFALPGASDPLPSGYARLLAFFSGPWTGPFFWGGVCVCVFFFSPFVVDGVVSLFDWEPVAFFAPSSSGPAHSLFAPAMSAEAEPAVSKETSESKLAPLAEQDVAMGPRHQHSLRASLMGPRPKKQHQPSLQGRRPSLGKGRRPCL